MDTKSTRAVGAQCGEHGTNTFYKAIKFYKNEKYRILALGEFFYLKIMRDIPMCCGELQMIWTNKQDDNQLLCSVRLYFLPEETPIGKLDCHGEDEILAVAEKMVLRADDLVPLIAENVVWTRGRQLHLEDEIADDDSKERFRYDFSLNNRGLNLSDVEQEKENIGDEGDKESTQLFILSFPQYCRYRAVLRRLEPMENKWLKNAIICAIGGITSYTRNNRIMFCRDLVDFPDLEDLECRCDHLAPSLRGRRRKNKEKAETKSDSDSYETASDISTVASAKINMLGKRDSALRNGLKFDKSDISTEEQEFLINLHSFMKKRGTPIVRIPSLGFKQIDLFYFYSSAKKLGGYEMVTQKRQWRHLYDRLGGNPNSTSAATFTRRHYEKLLLPFERHEKGMKIEKKSPKVKDEKDKGEDGKSPKLGKPGLDPKVNHFKKAKFKTTLTLKERALQWEQLRKLKEHEKAIRGKGVGGRPRTVKHLLDKSEKEKLSAAITNSMKVKEGAEENGSKESNKLIIDVPKVKLENDVDFKDDISKCSGSDSSAIKDIPSNIFSQSKLFKHDSLKSPLSPYSSEKHRGKLSESALAGLSLHHPQAAMFYPQSFLPVHPLGLPIMHHVPMGVPPFYSATSPLSEKHQSYRPNILKSNHRSSMHNSSSASNSLHHKHRSRASYSPPSPVSHSTSHAHSHSRSSSSDIIQSDGALIVPPAHSHGNKRAYPPSHANIPTQSSHTSSNKSLLFDFESPKRAKIDGMDLSSKKSGGCEDQPTDLSMKTLRKLQQDSDERELGEITRDTKYRYFDSPKSMVDSHQKDRLSQASKDLLSLPVFAKNNLSTSVFTSSSSSVPSPHRMTTSPYTSEKSKSSATSKAFSSSSAIKNSDTKSTSSKAFSGEESLSPGGIVHPAFMHPFMRPPVPQPNFFPTPLQLQQMYEAQIRGGAGQPSLFNGMQGLQDPSLLSRFPLPMFMPQVPLYTQSHKDKK